MMDTFSRNSREQKHIPFDHHDDKYGDHHDDYDDDLHQEEESGWTTYLEDFSNYYKVNEDDHRDGATSSCSVLSISPSLVSDAATGREYHHHRGGGSPASFPAKLKFRKLARTREICEDDCLEDTASSPVNSPKVSQFEQIQTTPRKIHKHITSSFVTGNGLITDQIHGEDDERGMKNLKDAKSDLRRKGLCLVPISMLGNYEPQFY